MLLSNRVVILFLAAMFLGRCGINLVEPFLAAHVRAMGPVRFLGDDPETQLDRTVALLFSALSLGTFLFSRFWIRRAESHGPVRMLALAGCTMGLCVFSMHFVNTSLALLSIRCVFAVAFAAILPLSYSAISRITDGSSIATAFALNQSAIQLAFGVGFIVGGVSAHWTSVSALFLPAGLLSCLAFSTLPWIRKVRREVLRKQEEQEQ